MRLPPPGHHARRAHALPQRRQRGVRRAAEEVRPVRQPAADVPLVALQRRRVEQRRGLGDRPGEGEGPVVVLGELVLREGVGPEGDVFEFGEDGLDLGRVGGRCWIWRLSLVLLVIFFLSFFVVGLLEASIECLVVVRAKARSLPLRTATNAQT